MRAEHHKSKHGASMGHEPPRRVRGMLLIGATARDAGKTTFACGLIERLVRELVIFSELGIGMQTKAVRTILKWLMTMYDTREGCFRLKFR